jgi:hypothetical protein
MENEEKTLNPQESLRIIRETIDLAKSSIWQNGFHFLLWGWLVVFASLADYYLSVVVHSPKHYMAWLSMTVIGVPVALIYEWRREKKAPTVANTVRSWYGRVWLAFGISLFITILLTAGARLSPIPHILVLAGFATFVSGALLRFKPLVYGSIAMWVGAMVCLVTNYQEHLLVEAVAMVAGYLIPGYLLNIQVRNRNV